MGTKEAKPKLDPETLRWCAQRAQRTADCYDIEDEECQRIRQLFLHLVRILKNNATRAARARKEGER